MGVSAVALGVATVVATPAMGYAQPCDSSPSASDAPSTDNDSAAGKPKSDAPNQDAAGVDALDDEDAGLIDRDGPRSSRRIGVATERVSRLRDLLDPVSSLADSVDQMRSGAVSDLRAGRDDRRIDAPAPVRRAVDAATRAAVAPDPAGADLHRPEMADVVTSVLSSPLRQLAGGLIPGVPDAPPPPGLWAVAAFARREFGADGQDAPDQTANAALRQVTTQLVATAEPPGPFFQAILDAVAGLRNFFVATFTRPSPIARELQFTTGEDTALSNTFDASAAFPDESLTYTVNKQGAPGGPRHGIVVVEGDTFTYIPEAGFTGVDTFTYVASDDAGFDPHLHLPGALNSVFGVFGSSFGGDHRASATVTVFVGPDDTIPDRITDELTIATYNIADLPFPLNLVLNQETVVLPRFTATAEISRRLNEPHETSDGRQVGFDVVNFQEDFVWHSSLVRNTLFPDATPTQVPDYLWPPGVPLIAGLNSVAKYEIRGLERIGFTDCGSFNCLTPKGFTYSQIQLPGGETIDVYNLHTDSGPGARTNDQIIQVSDYIQRNSAGRAVIVTGDWNQLYSEDNEVLSQFAADNRLTDAWVLQEWGGTAPTNADTCPNTNKCEQLDKIMFRSSAETIPGDPASRAVILELLKDPDTDEYVGYQNFGLAFQESDGTPLSDHRPVAATLAYRTLNNYTAPTP